MHNDKSTLVAYILFVFLGAFGIHRFYLKRPWTGILFFCTSGLFMIGLIWDLFMIPAMVDEANTCKCSQPTRVCCILIAFWAVYMHALLYDFLAMASIVALVLTVAYCRSFIASMVNYFLNILMRFCANCKNVLYNVHVTRRDHGKSKQRYEHRSHADDPRRR